MTAGIYQIQNSVDGKRYIGQSMNLEERWGRHLSGLRRGRYEIQGLQGAFDKYGVKVFMFSILEVVEHDLLREREQHYLDTLKPEYNIAGTVRPVSDSQHAPETRRKPSKLANMRRREVLPAIQMRGASTDGPSRAALIACYREIDRIWIERCARE